MLLVVGAGVPRESFFGLLLLDILVRGDVVDLDFVFLGVERAPILVGVVEAGDGALLDRAFRLVALLALRLALVLWRGVRAEVLRAGAAAHVAARTGGTRRGAARPRGIAARSAWRTRKASRCAAGAGREAAGARAAGTSVFARSRFADREAAAFEERLIEFSNRLFG